MPGGRPRRSRCTSRWSDSADRQLGPGHPVTLTARAHLAEAYQAAARGKEALTAYQMLMTDSERLLGTRHPTTLGTRERLAAALASQRLLQRTLADSERYLGPDHPMSKTTRENLEAATRT